MNRNKINVLTFLHNSNRSSPVQEVISRTSTWVGWYLYRYRYKYNTNIRVVNKLNLQVTSKYKALGHVLISIRNTLTQRKEKEEEAAAAAVAVAFVQEGGGRRRSRRRRTRNRGNS